MPPPLMSRPGQERRPWGAIITIGFVVLAGTASLPLQVATYRQAGEASKADQLRSGQQAICRQINQIATEAGLHAVDCSKINTPP